MCSQLKTLKRFLSRAINLSFEIKIEKYMSLSQRKRKPPRSSLKTIKEQGSSY
jgi:hypothetical protein